MHRTSRAFLRRAIVASLLGLSSTAYLVAQDAAAPDSTLPPVEVVGEQPTAPTEPPVPTPFDNAPPAYDLFSDGGVFESGLAEGYFAPSSTTGSILAIPDADLPATVNVIPSQVLRDQQVLQLSDVIRNAGAVQFGGGDTIFQDRIFIRGFELKSRDFRRDGFLDPTFVPRDFHNIERVEILKGPASTLYGAANPGGIVNLITKKPLDAEFVDFNYTFGSWERNRFTLDANGHANESGTVMYRFNGMQEDANSFRDFGFLSRTSLAPSVRWEIDENTNLVWQGEWHRDHRRADLGFPQVGGNALFYRPDLFVGEPGNDVIHAEEYRQSLVLTHALTDEWTAQIGGSSLFYEYPASFTTAAAEIAPPLYVRSRQSFTRADEQSQSVIANLAGEFCTGEVFHKALIGTEYVYFDSDSRLDFGGQLAPEDITALPYNNPFFIPFGALDSPVYRQQRVGIYAQDWIELTPEWKLVGGLRYDTVDLEYERTSPFGFPLATDQNFERWSPRGGVVYQPFADETLAVYYNYSRSFAPPSGGIYLNTTGLRPILGEGHELGVKTLLLDNLTVNAAGFYATRENADLNNTAFTLVQIAEERSQGMEFNVLGNITERWSATANYAYTDVRLIDPLTPAFDGNQQRNVPYNSANLWTRYNVVQDECQTLGAAIGLVYLDNRPGDLSNTFDLPSFTRWDAGLFYNRGRGYAALYAENIFDKYYAASSIDGFQVMPGAPANLRATVGFVY